VPKKHFEVIVHKPLFMGDRKLSKIFGMNIIVMKECPEDTLYVRVKHSWYSNGKLI
jgi:hypothetical protein